MTHPTILSALLLACLHDAPNHDLQTRLAQLSAVEWQQLVTLATEHRLETVLYHRLTSYQWDQVAPLAVVQALRQRYRQNAMNNLELYQGLAVVLARLHEQQIPVIVLKGAVLAAVLYADAAMRRMVDLDLLVHRGHVQHVTIILLNLGYQPLTPIGDYNTHLAGGIHHLPRFIKPGAPAIEIHWTITFSNHSYTIDPAPLWQRAQPLTIAGLAALSLCPEDLLLHICFHATYQHQLRQGVRFLCDIAEIVRHYQAQLQWPALIARAQEWGWQRGVFLALFLAQRLLGAAIPNGVLHNLNTDELSLVDVEELQAILFPEQLPLLSETSARFLALWSSRSLYRRLQLIGASLFLPRPILARLYAVPAHSPKLYGYYVVRLRDLLLRYARKSWRTWCGAPAMAALLERQERLNRWLAQPESPRGRGA